MKRIIKLALWCLLSTGFCYGLAKRHVGTVCVPVTDFQSAPLDFIDPEPHRPYAHHKDLPHLLTHLVYGQVVEILEQKGTWLFVESPDYPIWGLNRALRGWVRKHDICPESGEKKDAPGTVTIVVTRPWATTQPRTPASKPVRLPLGSVLQAKETKHGWLLVSQGVASAHVLARKQAERYDALRNASLAKKRALICAWAETLLGTPYCRGGQSPHDQGLVLHHHCPFKRRWQRTGMDCSALIHLLYRMVGITLPRSSVHQCQATTPITPQDLQPGDLIYEGTNNDFWSVCHCLLYVGNGQVIECSGRKEIKIFKAHKTSFLRRFCHTLAEYPLPTNPKHLFFRRALP